MFLDPVLTFLIYSDIIGVPWKVHPSPDSTFQETKNQAVWTALDFLLVLEEN